MMTPQEVRRLHENIAAIRGQIAAAATRSGRSPAEVRLIGVSKYVSASIAAELVAAGVVDLGESRPQELWRKAEALTGLPIRWHFIGHLQRNKLRRSLPLVSLLHSGDSLRLLEAVNAEATDIGRKVEVLLEVNISGDQAKHGFSPIELVDALPRLALLPQLKVTGLMAMAALEGGRELARRNFAALRELRDSVLPQLPPGTELNELSMGMSDDFDIAIEEGSTLVRVGSALFEGIRTEDAPE